jgi:hypothetical protein
MLSIGFAVSFAAQAATIHGDIADCDIRSDGVKRDETTAGLLVGGAGSSPFVLQDAGATNQAMRFYRFSAPWSLRKK